ALTEATPCPAGRVTRKAYASVTIASRTREPIRAVMPHVPHNKPVSMGARAPPRIFSHAHPAHGARALALVTLEGPAKEPANPLACQQPDLVEDLYHAE